MNNSTQTDWLQRIVRALDAMKHEVLAHNARYRSFPPADVHWSTKEVEDKATV